MPLRLTRISAPLVIALLLLSGCGGDDDAGGDSGSPPESSTASLTANLEAINDALTVSGFIVEPVSVGAENEVPALLTDADDEIYEGTVLVFDRKSEGDLKGVDVAEYADAGLESDAELGSEGFTEDLCGQFVIVGNDDDLQRAVNDLVCG